MTRTRRISQLGRWIGAIALLLLLVLLALVPTAPVAASTVTVKMVSGHLFEPATITIRPGTTVTWINTDTIELHNVAEANGSFGIGSLAYGQTYSYPFPPDASGTYYYSCTFHSGMDGAVIVALPPTNTPVPAPMPHAPAVPTMTATSASKPAMHTAAASTSISTPRALPARR